MRFLNIFRLPKPQSFRYIPQYYDPDKEDLQERLKRIELEREANPEAMKARIASGFKRGGGGLGDRSLRKKMVFKSNLMVIAIVAILLMLAVLFLNSYFGRILESLM